MYLEELADTGLIGFTLFMSILGLTLHELFQVRRYWMDSRPDIGYLVAGLIVAIFAYMSTAVFLHLSYVRYYWVILALAGAAVNIFSKDMAHKDGMLKTVPTSQRSTGLASTIANGGGEAQ